MSMNGSPRQPSGTREEPSEVVCFIATTSTTSKLGLVVHERAGKEVARHLVLTELPDGFLFTPKSGKLEWLTDSTLALRDKDGKRVGQVKVSQSP